MDTSNWQRSQGKFVHNTQSYLFRSFYTRFTYIR
ncbi:hypothetical protein NQ318_018316 [Aromia moschata]|uniref:Uncharacterized protein n=1 Tax=Aromia moschata TaxID=1265417 RepID=A0AAV8ZE21_9CUCU|nr:hypothetical protein NQ318_018316 [Aromia moschata]